MFCVLAAGVPPEYRIGALLADHRARQDEQAAIISGEIAHAAARAELQLDRRRGVRRLDRRTNDPSESDMITALLSIHRTAKAGVETIPDDRDALDGQAAVFERLVAVVIEQRRLRDLHRELGRDRKIVGGRSIRIQLETDDLAARLATRLDLFGVGVFAARPPMRADHIEIAVGERDTLAIEFERGVPRTGRRSAEPSSRRRCRSCRRAMSRPGLPAGHRRSTRRCAEIRWRSRRLSRSRPSTSPSRPRNL